MNTSNRKQTLIRVAKILAVSCVVLIALVVLTRDYIITPFRVPTGAVAPEVPKGSLVLVNRLSSDFKPGDIIAYRPSDDPRTWLARCDTVSASTLHVSRDGEPQFDVSRSAIVGKVVGITR